jgi:hypothetical protein
MHTLDLLSQVLFVGLMAMFLYVLYKRFVRMISQDRLQGNYAKVVRCDWESTGLAVAIESEGPVQCTVSWSGGDMKLESPGGRYDQEIVVRGMCPDEVTFTFDNQVVRRKL